MLAKYTAMEGNKMAKSGRAGAALATAAIGSFVAGTIATVFVTFLAPVIATHAVKLGPPEYFMLMGYHKTNLLMRYRKTNLVGEGKEESFREGGGELMSSEKYWAISSVIQLVFRSMVVSVLI